MLRGSVAGARDPVQRAPGRAGRARNDSTRRVRVAAGTWLMSRNAVTGRTAPAAGSGAVGAGAGLLVAAVSWCGSSGGVAVRGGRPVVGGGVGASRCRCPRGGVGGPGAVVPGRSPTSGGRRRGRPGRPRGPGPRPSRAPAGGPAGPARLRLGPLGLEPLALGLELGLAGLQLLLLHAALLGARLVAQLLRRAGGSGRPCACVTSTPPARSGRGRRRQPRRSR